jgi:hypothetical protein
VAYSLDAVQDDDRIVYRHKRSLEGIVGECYFDDQPTIVTSALGQAADEYLHAHGYQPGSIRLIQKFFEEAGTKDDFVSRMAQHGVPVAEAVYLHSLVVKKTI